MVNALSGVNGLNGGFAASPFGRLSALRTSDRTGLDPVLFFIEEAQIILHKADLPDLVVDLEDADELARF